MIDKEMIKRARQANLAEYLLSVGVPLVKVGNRHKHKEHDSLVFTKMPITGIVAGNMEIPLITLSGIWKWISLKRLQH